MVPRILDVGTRWRWVFRFTHRPLEVSTFILFWQRTDMLLLL